MWDILKAAIGIVGMTSKNHAQRHAGLHLLSHALSHLFFKKR